MVMATSLRLQTNEIFSIDANAFSGLNKLQLLQLSGNPISNFQEFKLPAVPSMDFLYALIFTYNLIR
ncbi:hypothetical protein TrispH2_008991 [Trichoplax sp. H2]|nr:hypothetical protein TrispH2_008991 [Trichoplax sp. H2]|eukprot:RDD38939.1 hypothetical protein TrispH2_008991 [Trichoplax sp. H2]